MNHNEKNNRDNDLINNNENIVVSGFGSRNLAIDNLDRLIRDNTANNISTGIILVKFNALKEIISTFGFKKGDDFLLQCLKRVKQSLHPADIIYKLSDNNYLISLSKIFNEGHAILAANKINMAFKRPVSIDNHNVSANIHMGIAIHPAHAKTSEELVKYALKALDLAISERYPYTVWPGEDTAKSKSNIIIETELSNAIAENNFNIHYQPKLDIRNNKIVGVECLARWASPTYGVLPPDYFIPIAENAGLIDDLTVNIINLALRESREWTKSGNHLTLSINLSAINLQDGHLVEMIKRALNIWDVSPDRIIFEVTESAIMLNPELSLNILTELNKSNIRCSIDDFGTGYSSFAYLKKLPVSELKIDKSFVINMSANKEDAIIAKAIVELAHNFNMFVTAEGVENAETLNKLANMNCEYAQGYYIAKPMSNEKFMEWVGNCSYEF
jgi:diguanylate cyclase (GGDEF)-like protein